MSFLKRQEQVQETSLFKGGKFTTKDMAEAMGWKETSTRTVLNDMVRDGHLFKIPGGRTMEYQRKDKRVNWLTRRW